MTDNDQYLNKAKHMACMLLNAHRAGTDEPRTSPDDFYVVWFCKTLGNWKALVSTDVTDGLYFEVTHNGAKQETYTDIYSKILNTAVSDSDL